MCIYIICIYTICHNGWCGHHIIILPSIMMLRSNSGGRLRWDIASIASTVRRMGKGRRVVFSRMRSKGSRFTLGVWGLRVCSLDVAFVVAAARNRSCEDRMAVPMGSSAEVVIFGGFRCVVASFRVAGVALRDIQTCSATCRKSFCVVGAILLWRFQKMCCSFSWQAQHFGRVHRHFSWQAQHFRRVVLRVFCKSHWQGCVKWRQGANSVAGVAFSDMCWKLTEASHETSILRLQIFRF